MCWWWLCRLCGLSRLMLSCAKRNNGRLWPEESVTATRRSSTNKDRSCCSWDRLGRRESRYGIHCSSDRRIQFPITLCESSHTQIALPNVEPGRHVHSSFCQRLSTECRDHDLRQQEFCNTRGAACQSKDSKTHPRGTRCSVLSVYISIR